MPEKISRRFFMGVTGGLGVTAVSDKPHRWIDHLVSMSNPMKETRSGVWYNYATTCRECPAGCGMLVRYRDGRAVKCEGNPLHPVNRGGLCPRGQSAVQGLYDPDRITEPLIRTGDTWNISAWDAMINDIAALINKHKGRIAVITGLQTGTLLNIITRFSEIAGSPSRLLIYEPFNYEYLRDANRIAFGTDIIPRYYFDKADCILSLGCDFLETWVSPVEYTRGLADARTPSRQNDHTLAYMIYAGPRRSMTAANADSIIFTKGQSLSFLGLALLKRLQINNRIIDERLPVDSAFQGRSVAELDALSGIQSHEIDSIADRLTRASNPLVVAGPTAARNSQWASDAALAAGFLNRALGVTGSTLDFSMPHALSITDTENKTESFLKEIAPDDLVFILDTNIVFTRPSSESHLKRAGSVVYLGTLMDETALIAHRVLPIDSPLESWGEYEPYPGVNSLQQPSMKRLLDTRSEGDILLSLLQCVSGQSDSFTFENAIKDRWRNIFEQKGQKLNFASFWISALRNGGYFQQTTPMPRHTGSAYQVNSLDIERTFKKPVATENGILELWSWASIMFFDGRTANRDWLQENPEPVSQLVWDSWAEVHPSDAKVKLKIDNQDLVEVGTGTASIRLPVRVTDDVVEGTVSVMIGQGHVSSYLHVATPVGANAFKLLYSGEGEQDFSRILIRKVGWNGKLVSAIATSHQHGRDILKTVSLDELRKSGSVSDRIDWPLPKGYSAARDLYPPHQHKQHRWAMVIDLQRCTGCQACAVACYAENNIDVVGKPRIDLGREMAWLKVIPYYYSEKPERIAWLPLLCQHCDAAPCEPVCPVFASVHMSDGLNAQVYNRCIGTRDCMNNCPYKVRRFNWLNPQWRDPLNMQLNPEVTVRCRGVMEKCTFCVQRIRNAEFRAKVENRKVREDEIQPACVQSCPARVFTFGDLLDKDSAVYRYFESDPRRYQVLRELNTKPAVVYLKKIRQEP